MTGLACLADYSTNECCARSRVQAPLADIKAIVSCSPGVLLTIYFFTGHF
jgi:hypothetical protein